MSYGLHQDQARLLFDILQKAQHRIKTGFGVSDNADGIADPPIQGKGQGNGKACTVWALISSKMIETMKKNGHDVKLTHSL